MLLVPGRLPSLQSMSCGRKNTLPGVQKDLCALPGTPRHTEGLDKSLLMGWVHKSLTSRRSPSHWWRVSTHKGVPGADLFAAEMTSEVNSFGPLRREKSLSVINKSLDQRARDRERAKRKRDLEARPAALSQRLGWDVQRWDSRGAERGCAHPVLDDRPFVS